MSYIGLDIGTSGCKASVVSKSGEVIAHAHAEYQLLFPEKGYVELEAASIFRKVKQVLRELSPKAAEADVLALSSFGEAFVLLDEEDRPLNHFITYADERCEGIDEMLIERFGAEKFFDITGTVPNQSFSLCKLLWMKKNRPELLERARKLFLANDYFNYLLCGGRGVDYGTASKTLLFDVKKSCWSKELMEMFDIPAEWFSPPLRVGSCLGTIRRQLARELGLPSGLKICLGCHDQCNATLGGGACMPGYAMMGEGSTESINLIVDASSFSFSEELVRRRMCVEPFLESDRYMIPCSILTYGNALRWYIGTLEEETGKLLSPDEDIFSYLEKRSQTESGLIFLPNLSKVNIMDPQSRVPGAFLGITLNTKKWEFYRAVMQGLNFESAVNLETLKSIGVPVQYISATGGITKSGLFMQMKADILKREIRVLENTEAGIMGLAMICAVAQGDVSGYGEAVEQFVRIKKVYTPQKDYTELFEAYKDVRRRLR